MTRHFLPPTATFVMFGGLASIASAASAEPAAPVTVAVRLQDEAAVPAAALAKAKDTVVDICRRAGLRIVWMDSTDSVEPSAEPSSESIRELRMTVISNATAGARGDVGGFAHMTEQFANVFFGKVKEVAAHTGIATGTVLGHVMAHEIGHLLLPSGSHSTTGIMRAVWAAPEYVSAGQGHLGFTSEQGVVMRARLTH